MISKIPDNMSEESLIINVSCIHSLIQNLFVPFMYYLFRQFIINKTLLMSYNIGD